MRIVSKINRKPLFLSDHKLIKEVRPRFLAFAFQGDGFPHRFVRFPARVGVFSVRSFWTNSKCADGDFFRQDVENQKMVHESADGQSVHHRFGRRAFRVTLLVGEWFERRAAAAGYDSDLSIKFLQLLHLMAPA